MGCVQSKQTYLFLTDNEDIPSEVDKIIVRDDKQLVKTKKTPTSYLTKVIILSKKVPVFVRDFFELVNNRGYDDCEFHENKDIFYFSDFVYTVEFTKKYYVYRRKKLFKRIEKMKYSKNVVVPESIFYIPIEEHSGVIIQKMEYCKGGDMFDFMFDPSKKHKDIHRIIHDLSSTLIELHENNIFLNDIKPENIFISTSFKFGDIEDAFIDQPFMNDDDFKDNDKKLSFLVKNKTRWVRTLRYCPDKEYPITRKLAIRNDIYAFIMSLGLYICKKVYNKEPSIFTGKIIPSEMVDKVKDGFHSMFNDRYIDLAVEYILDYNKIDTNVLFKMRDLAQINIL